MSTTKQLIDQLKPYCGEWERSTGDLNILGLIQRAQDALFDYDAPGMHYLGTDNKGWPPYLTTVAGTYEYEITATNLTNVTSLVRTIGGTDYPMRAKMVLKVFVDSTSYDYGISWIGNPYLYTFQNPYARSTERLFVADLPVASWECTEYESAKVIFKEDPGTSTDRYFVSFTIEPPRLLSENVPLIVPLQFETAIQKYVLGTIQELENGKENEHLYGSHGFYTYWKPKFNERMSSASNDVNTKTQRRPC